MPSKPFPFFSHRFAIPGVAYRRLVVALAFSLLMHLLLLGGFDLHLPTFAAPEQVVEVQLAPVAPAVKAVPSPAPPKKISRPRPQAPSLPEPEPISQPAPAVSEPAALPAPISDAVVDERPSSDAQVPPPIEEPAVQAEEAPADDMGEPADNVAAIATEDSPSYVETDFDIRRSIDGGKVGVTHISYRAQADGSYVINSVSEAQGLLSLFLSDKLVQRSEGRITENGLQPSRFLYQFGDKARKKQLALFDWQAGQLTLQTGKGTKTEPLPAGTQDLLSFMYQFMFVPPLAQMQLSVTNGKSLSAYTYSFEGEEQLSTRMGDIKTLHILKKGDDGEEKTELWLAVDYHYLPVKMRKTDEDGSVVEQAATNISTNTLK